MGNVPFFPSFRSDGVGSLQAGGLQQALLPEAAAGVKIQEERRDTGHPTHGRVTDTRPSLGVPPQPPSCPCRGGSQLGAGSASQIPSRARKCFLMFNLHFTPCSTWTGVASQPVLSSHTRGVPAAPAGWGVVPCLTHTPSGGSPSRESAFPPHWAQRAEAGLAGPPWDGSLGWAIPFLMAPLWAGSATSALTPLMQHQSYIVTPLDAQDSCGINPMGIWLSGKCVLGMGTSRVRGVQPLLGAEEQLCLFSICCGEQQEKYFFLLLFILFFRGFVCSSPARIHHVNILLCL